VASRITAPASFLPWNHSAAVTTPPDQTESPVNRYARQQASLIAATSIGC
jgi:hypothetical protein